MANMKVEAKRVKSGFSLTQYEVNGTNAINTIKQIKTQLIALKQEVNADPDYTAEDVTVVQQVIDDLQGQLATI